MDNYINDKKLFMLYGLEMLNWSDMHTLHKFNEKVYYVNSFDFVVRGYVQWFDRWKMPTKSFFEMRYMKYTEKFIEDIINAS